MKKATLSFVALLIITMVFSINSFAVTLLTTDQAVKEMFPDVDEVVTVAKALSAEEIASIKAQMGGSLVHYQDGSKSEAVAEATKYDIYVGMKGGQKVRMAIVEEQPGKWGPVTFIVAINAATGKIDNLAVMSYVEKRGRPIARKNFLKQFFGKGTGDAISVRSKKGVKRDIRSISGATISSDCACFAARKVLSIYENVYLTMQQASK